MGEGMRHRTNARRATWSVRACLVAALALSVASCDWSMFRNAPDGTASSGDAPAWPEDADTLTEAWSAETGGAIVGSTAVVGDTAFVGSMDGALHAFDAHGERGCTGAPRVCSSLWTAPTGGSITSSPAVVGGVAYVGSADGNVYAFDALGETGCGGEPRTCAPLWTASTGGPIRSSPVIAGGVLYVGSDDGNLYGFDATGTTGCAGEPVECEPMWTGPTGAAVSASPAVAGGIVYIGSEDGLLHAFDATGQGATCAPEPTTCTPLWTAATGGAVTSSAAVASGTVFVGSTDGRLYAFDATGSDATCAGEPRTCTSLWTGATGGPIDSSPAVAGGRVFVGSDDDTLYAFAAMPTSGCLGDPAGCPPEWTATTGGDIDSSPAVAGDLVFVGSLDSSIYAFEATGDDCPGSPGECRPRWRTSTGAAVQSSPVVGNGTLFAGSSDGTLHAWRRPVGDWPQYQFGPSRQGVNTTERALSSDDLAQLGRAWTGPTGRNVFSSPAVVDDVVYVGSDDGKLYAFDATGTTGCSGDPKECEPLWTAATGWVIPGGPAVVDGVVYVGTYGGGLFAFDAAGVEGCSGTPDDVLSPVAGADGLLGRQRPSGVAGTRHRRRGERRGPCVRRGWRDRLLRHTVGVPTGVASKGRRADPCRADGRGRDRRGGLRRWSGVDVRRVRGGRLWRDAHHVPAALDGTDGPGRGLRDTRHLRGRDVRRDVRRWRVRLRRGR